MCIFDTCFRLAPYKLCHSEGKQQCVFLTHCIWNRLTFVRPYWKTKTKTKTNAAWPYLRSFWTFFLNVLGPWIQHSASIWWSLYNANLRHVSEMHIFQNTHHANLKHVSGWHTFQNGTKHTQLWTKFSTQLFPCEGFQMQTWKWVVQNHEHMKMSCSKSFFFILPRLFLVNVWKSYSSGHYKPYHFSYVLFSKLQSNSCANIISCILFVYLHGLNNESVHLKKA